MAGNDLGSTDVDDDDYDDRIDDDFSGSGDNQGSFFIYLTY